MESLTNEQRRAVLDQYMTHMEAEDLRPDAFPFPYNAVAGVKEVKWSLQLFAESLVSGELQEMTNALNRWKGALRRWDAWNRVLAAQDEEARWDTELEFVEPVAFLCMFQPSAARDHFTLVATNALHQVRLTIGNAYKDKLLGDPESPGKSGRFPPRSGREQQLANLAQGWGAADPFLAALKAIDSKDYRKLTADFRNRASHGITPNFSYGYTAIVTRQVVQASRLEQQPDGTYRDTPIPGKLSVRYGYGGTPPLQLADAWTANLEQFVHAKTCFDAFVVLLTEAVGAMPVD